MAGMIPTMITGMIPSIMTQSQMKQIPNETRESRFIEKSSLTKTSSTRIISNINTSSTDMTIVLRQDGKLTISEKTPERERERERDRDRYRQTDTKKAVISSQWCRPDGNKNQKRTVQTDSLLRRRTCSETPPYIHMHQRGHEYLHITVSH